MKTLICNCNQTMPLDAKAISTALGEDTTIHTTLCRREAASFQRAIQGDDEVLVACTQEQRLFTELAAQTEGSRVTQEQPLRFVNIRETGGWSRAAKDDAQGLTPKLAALIAAAKLPAPEPVSTVTYKSEGRVLITGPADKALAAAALLEDKLEVTVLATHAATSATQSDQERRYSINAGSLIELEGWLGNFKATWQTTNPIDLDLCTRCNACVDVCPEGAIDNVLYQIDLTRCTNHRDCVKACAALGAIDFARDAKDVQDNFDLVFDVSAAPFITLHAPPQGYFHANSDAALLPAVLKLRELIGEFEKPKFFNYNAKICAHGRNETVGCNACVEVCSAQAISSDLAKNAVVVNPNLCIGCGACTTVCPTGAMSYGYPKANETGVRIKTLLSSYRAAGGDAPVLLLHSQGAGAKLIDQLGSAVRSKLHHKDGLKGMLHNVLPLSLWHTASVGLDVWLSAIAYGARQVVLMTTNEEAPDYVKALTEQMAVGQAVLTGLGYSGKHLQIASVNSAGALDAVLSNLQTQSTASVKEVARFAISTQKRTALEAAIEHLAAQAPLRPEVIDLAGFAAAPFGEIKVNKDTCTLCLSCVSACPASALLDNAEKPQLRLIEKNCVQCGLCVKTCPEDAITLAPRLLLTPQKREPRVLNEVPPYECIRCGKPFGTIKAIEAMLGKLAGHSMFQGEALERLKMCSDCRVIDIYSSQNEKKITDV
jgi:ferredoxin